MEEHKSVTSFFRPDDFQSFLVGTWKRNLEWREFGGSFGFVRSSNAIIKIVEQDVTVGSNATGVRHLKWSFGQSMNEAELRYAYTMKSTKDPATGDVSFEWDYIGTPCKGQYISATSVAVLNFFQKKSTVVATYRVLDPNTVSVCVVEGEMGKPAIIQYGNMYRINPSLYSEGN